MHVHGLGPAVISVLIIEGVLAGIFIGSRYLTRIYLGGNPGWDDYTLMVTWVRCSA